MVEVFDYNPPTMEILGGLFAPLETALLSRKLLDFGSPWVCAPMRMRMKRHDSGIVKLKILYVGL